MALTRESKELEKRVAGLLRRIRSPYVGERADAEREFGELGPDGIDALFNLVNAKTRLWLKRRRAYFGLLALFLCVAVPLMAYQIYLGIQAGIAGDGASLGRYFGVAFGGILGPFGGGILGGFAWLLVPPSELLLAANLLVHLEDPRSIRPLIRVLSSRMMDSNLRFAAAEALCRLLPILKEESGSVLGSEDRQLLARYLLRSAPEKEEKLVRAILEALSWSGDTETLRTLKSFEKRVTGEVRAATADAIVRLEERLSLSAKSENLLRAAEHSGAESALLRPATGDMKEDPAQLLRAGPPADAT
jgi:hypothetical protein